MKLVGAEPANVFSFFEEISAIPRGSGHTEGMARYLGEFAEKRGLGHKCDTAGNTVIKKSGSPGRENEEPVILQGHTDMVWEKGEGVSFDFEKEGLRLCRDGDYIYAQGTTLGGDDGIAVAIMLAVLDDESLSHPPLECLFTVDEEIGMLGAAALDVSMISGRRMINLDSEAENVFWVSCAGGARTDIRLECFCKVNSLNTYEITVSGLHGGHSGTEIDKGYASANILMGNLLDYIANCKGQQLYVSEIHGGKMDNAITRECRCKICCGGEIRRYIPEFLSIQKEKYPRETRINVSIEETESAACFDEDTTDRIIGLLRELPWGVVKMSEDIPGLVQTSLNLGILDSSEDSVKFGFSVRSSVNGEKQELLENLKVLSEKYGASVEIYGEYPAWEYRKVSPLRDVMTKAYSELYGFSPEVCAIHAGLECGLFAGKIKDLDCVSIGPDMLDIHTPQEKLSISSTQRIYGLVLKTLEKI